MKTKLPAAALLGVLALTQTAFAGGPAYVQGSSQAGAPPEARHWTIPPISKRWGVPHRSSQWTIPPINQQWGVPERSSQWTIPPINRQWGVPQRSPHWTIPRTAADLLPPDKD